MFKFWASSEEFDTTQFGTFDNDTSLPLDEIDDSVWSYKSGQHSPWPTKKGEILGFSEDEIFGDTEILEERTTTTTTTSTTTTTPKPMDPSFELNAWFKRKNLIFQRIKNAESDKDILDMMKSGWVNVYI